MSTLQAKDFIAAWMIKLQDATKQPSDPGFDGRVSLPAWLSESARDQAERVFLVLDNMPIKKRKLKRGRKIVEDSAAAFLDAWKAVVTQPGTDPELWMVEAAQKAMEAYHVRLDELAPGFSSGGAA